MNHPVIIVAFASLFAALFGFAIVRGGVCTLAAMEDLVLKGKGNRLQGFAEIWVWVAAFFLLAYYGWDVTFTSATYSATAASIVGGLLLALGAFINQACPFGTIAGIGSGYWAYLATPVGLFVGSVIHYRHLSFLSPEVSTLEAPLFDVSPIALFPISLFLGWRVLRIIRGHVTSGGITTGLRSAWTPLSASVIVGISFSLLALLVGGWSYTQLLGDLASQRYERLGERALFFVAMFAGALIGGLTDKGWHPKPATLKDVLLCFTGGLLMGIGNKLVPGAHDSLTLIGQPLLLPYAWVSMAIIYLTLATTYWVVKLRARSRK